MASLPVFLVELDRWKHHVWLRRLRCLLVSPFVSLSVLPVLLPFLFNFVTSPDIVPSSGLTLKSTSAFLSSPASRFSPPLSPLSCVSSRPSLSPSSSASSAPSSPSSASLGVRPHFISVSAASGTELAASLSSTTSSFIGSSSSTRPALNRDSACRQTVSFPARLSPTLFPLSPDTEEGRGSFSDLQQLRDSREERFAALKSMREQETPRFQAEDWTPDQPLLEIKDLRVEAEEDGQEILKGVNLTIMPGEVHAIMGRNGSGKSTLSKVLAGYPSYKVTAGEVRYKGLDLLELPIDNRGLAGLFLAFQYPIEIPLVSNLEFLRVAFNERRKWKKEPEVVSYEFRELVEGRLKEVGLDPSFLDRPLNYGFSGGEKKRNEILQMLVLDPELVMLDETDSGLDVDSFNITANAIKRFSKRKGKSFLVTTHYKKLLDVLQPHKIHVMHAGKIVLSGSMDLAGQIEAEGFQALVGAAAEGEEEEERDRREDEGEREEHEGEDEAESLLSPSAAGGGRRNLDRLL
ncbi:iron-sulfur assembly ATPase [Toxoplasma gondii TgCatPRC2]|uniref:Iron-sulfur assembly ATPase n=1 Tax=Toxoplasma gondii TgCatPRC2 TaxID=1130821 RepID=A0A151HRA2_TOXGO|nr:iron-sulfur assembly ATPase [Toxoplasma gondii TgCatPRC2]